VRPFRYIGVGFLPIGSLLTESAVIPFFSIEF
jgi:hypothetical protein